MTASTRILYMEDDRAVARLICARLAKLGYQVDVAIDGRAGLAAFAAGRHDLLLLDQSMPGLDGLGVIRTLAAAGPLPPTIIVTGTGDEATAVEAMRLGVSDYLIKDMSGGYLKVLPLAISRVLQRRRMEEELAQAQKLEAIGQLAAGIAHEINTPIQYVGDNTRFLQEAFADLLGVVASTERLLAAAERGELLAAAARDLQARRDEADLDYLAREIPHAIEQSLEGVDRVARIVRAMKEFSHPGGGQKQAADLNRAIENTLTVSRNEWKYVAELVTDFDPELPLVPVLLGSFNQAILNLVMNASQAVAAALGEDSQRLGTITLGTRRAGDWVEIRVGDTGCGITENIRDRVFDPFFTTKEVGKGTGQGLSIVHSVVVEEHGGSITFESQVGKGTTFLIRLPLADVAAPLSGRLEPSTASEWA